MTYDEFLNFLDQFEEIKSFAGRIKFADQYLQRIGSGTGRVVYDIDGEKIFKIAKNAKGVAQNDAESDVGRYQDTHNIVTKIFDFDNNGSWIIAEKAKKVNERRIKELTGISSLNDLYYYLRNFVEENRGKRPIFNQDEKIKEELEENEFIVELVDLISNYNQQPGDFGRPSTYGEVLRDGQPSIVLTDYGLNDEVYDTHYNPKRREKYRIYELFGLHGNDDILSDIGNTHEVRHGMWGLIPYNVSDGDGVINEGFISFVLDRDKYPTRPLPNMPYIVDQFHECMNNIHETLNHVDNKKKFYNNLLNLQEYLISQGAYDRDPLMKEEYPIFEIDIPKVQSLSAGDEEYGTFLANAFTTKLNLETPQYLDSGSYGHAFRVGNDSVLKITSDISEVNASFKILRHGPPTYLVDIHKIYKIVDTENNKAFFAILQEYIPERPKELFHEYNDVIDTVQPNGLDSFSFMKNLRKNFDYNKSIEDAKHILIDNPDTNIPEEKRKGVYGYMVGLTNIQQELINFGVKSDDYTNAGNLGYKNGILKYFDIGSLRREEEPEMAQQDVVYLPEEEQIDEYGTARFTTDSEIGQDGYPTYNQNDTSPSIENNLDANSAMYNEDLEYNHVVGDATEDEYKLTERKLTYMPKAKAVNVKKKCRLGGLGNTSAACNQGDISNLEFTSLDESFSFNKEFWGWVSPDNRLIQVPKLKHLGWIMTQYKHEPFGWDGERVFNKALEDGWVRVTYEYSPQQFRGDLSINGSTKERVVETFKKFFYDMTKYGYYTIYLEWETPTREYLVFNTRDTEGKQKLFKYLNEEIDASEAYTDDNSLKTLISGKRDVAFFEIHKGNVRLIQKHGLGILPVRVTPQNTIMGIVYRDKEKGDKLYKFAKSRGGFLIDKSPEEAREVGKLLGYNDKSITEYIRRKYGSKIPILPEPSPDDYDDLHEHINQNELNRGIFKDEPMHVPNFPLKNLTVSKRGIIGAIQDIKQGHPSRTNEPILVFYNISNKTFLVEDGYHRVAQAYLNKQKTIPANIYSDMWSDYVANVSPENKFDLNEAELMSLQSLPFKDEIQKLGGKIYSVGGAVRDEFLGKESKDLDILITGVPMEELEQLLSKYGRVDAVGKSFGILKFKPKGATEEIDIAIPRTEKPSGEGGHKGFDVTSDHALPIEKDLERRDFTINAIAKDIDGNVVDPYGGQEDLKNKTIRIVNPDAFSDDPLRMLRAVQFASRFGFTIEPETLKMIQNNAGRIKEIPAERILTEFDKIVKKGNKLTGAQLLKNTGLFQQIFGFDIKQSTIDRSPFDDVKTMGEFIFLLTRLLPNPAEFYKNNLKGDIDTYKEIKALNMAFESAEATNLIEARAIASNMYNTAPQSLQSEILPAVIKTAAQELLSGKYPKGVGDLAINGNDLMQLGLQGKEIGDTLKSMLLKVYSGKVRNNREDLLNLTPKNNDMLTEILNPMRAAMPSRWNVNGRTVDVEFFVKEYDKWNRQGGSLGYRDPSRTSVLEFLQNNYEDFSNDETLKKELYWALTDREVLNENKSKSKYSKTKESIRRSKSIGKEMKDEILKYVSSGSKYREGGIVTGLIIPKIEGKSFDGVSMGADKDGFFVYTHRARSKSHPTPEKITKTEIKFIESTG